MESVTGSPDQGHILLSWFPSSSFLSVEMSVLATQSRFL